MLLFHLLHHSYSFKNKVRTEQLLVFRNYFGLHRSQVTLLVLGNEHEENNATRYPNIVKEKVYLQEVHEVLHSSLTARKWLRMGVKWLYFFPELNGLSLVALPALIGTSIDRQLLVNALASPSDDNCTTFDCGITVYNIAPSSRRQQEGRVVVLCGNMASPSTPSEGLKEWNPLLVSAPVFAYAKQMLVNLEHYTRTVDKIDRSNSSELESEPTRRVAFPINVTPLWYALPSSASSVGITIAPTWM